MDDGGPLQTRNLARRIKHMSSMSSRGHGYQPKLSSVNKLLSRAHAKQELAMKVGLPERPNYADDDSDDSVELEETGPSDRRVCVKKGTVSFGILSKVLQGSVVQVGRPFFKEAEIDRLQKLLEAAGDGFVLRGWRRKFDNTGALQAPFPKFCRVCVEIGFVRNTTDLYNMPRDFSNITLSHVTPHFSGVLASFQKWIHAKYRDVATFFDVFDPDHKNKISIEDFIEACVGEGYAATELEFCELFACCDWEGNGAIIRDNVVYLETDLMIKDREMAQIKKRKQYEFDQLFLSTYAEERENPLPAGHRNAIRPWIAKHFEEMPEIRLQNRVIRLQNRARKGLEARMEFVRKIRRFCGNEVTAWRRLLDVDEKFIVSEAVFRQVCRNLDFSGDVNALWSNFDPDHDGTLSLEQLSPESADVLASFRRWLIVGFGSCVAFWQSPECLAKRRKAHPNREGDSILANNMSIVTFLQVLNFYECPFNATCHYICKCLDKSGGEFICLSDLAWLDKWDPPEALTLEPDEDAWEDFKVLLLNKFGHLLKAWIELDRGCGRLSWPEFRDACGRLGFQGSVGGAWRWLDKDLIGWISLAAMDKESFDTLSSFKVWAEARFGSVELAFKAIGGAASSFTCHELRIACHQFQWPGNTRMLFKILTKNGEHISFKDASFLSVWVISDQESISLLKTTRDILWKELFQTKPALHASASCPGRSRPPSSSTIDSSHGRNRQRPNTTSTIESTSDSFLEFLKDTETRGFGSSMSSLPESMYSVPDNHCSPYAPFFGAPFARPVLGKSWTPPVQAPKWRSDKTRAMQKSKSEPSLLSRPESGASGRNSCQSSGRLGNFAKSSGPSRKKNLIGSIGGSSASDAAMREEICGP